MSGQPLLFSIMESATHPNFSKLYEQLGIKELRFNSHRRAINKLKNNRPDFVVAEFFYGYSNNYAGVNISNLDVLLYSLQKYAPDARIIVLVSKAEAQYVSQLDNILPLHGVLTHPVAPADILPLLEAR